MSHFLGVVDVCLRMAVRVSVEEEEEEEEGWT